MSVRLDDAAAVITNAVAAALLSVQVNLRAEGVPAAGTAGDWAELDLRWSPNARGAQIERTGCAGRLTCYLKVDQGAIRRAETVGQAVRAALVAQNLPVYGGISGTPGDLQGILQAVDFLHATLGENAGEIITESTFNLIERT